MSREIRIGQDRGSSIVLRRQSWHCHLKFCSNAVGLDQELD